MMLIEQLLEAIRKNGGIANLEELSRQLDIQPGALQGILSFCAQKGYLTLDSGGENSCNSCAVVKGCPWVSHEVTCYRLK